MKWLIVLSLVLIALVSNGQVNYVRNASLEDYSNCPYMGDAIFDVYYWSALDSTIDSTSIIYGRPEYYNACAGNGSYGIPNVGVFSVNPHTGSGMAQVQMFFDEDFPEQNKRDYLQGRLYTSLKVGKSYCVTFYVARELISAYAINHIGAYLDDGSIDTNNCKSCIYTHYIPQVFENDVIDDTAYWYKVKGSFIANGTEKFITITDFFDTAHTSYRLATNPGFNNFGYYLVDDVSVVESDLPAYGGNDTIIHQGDTILIGRNEEALDCKWYVNSNLIDSGAGIKVHPDTTTTYVVRQDVCGLIKYDTVTVTVWPLAVNDPKRQFSFDVSPNPSQGSFAINSNGIKNGTVVIFNSIGQLMYKSDIKSDRQQVSINIPDGIYIVELSDDLGNRKQKRLIINK